MMNSEDVQAIIKVFTEMACNDLYDTYKPEKVKIKSIDDSHYRYIIELWFSTGLPKYLIEDLINNSINFKFENNLGKKIISLYASQIDAITKVKYNDLQDEFFNILKMMN